VQTLGSHRHHHRPDLARQVRAAGGAVVVRGVVQGVDGDPDRLGLVQTVPVRSRNIGSQIGATLKSLGGGELKGMTKMLAEGRAHATERLVEEAEGKGADAIIAFRFDTSELGTTWTEICAYGTAVKTTKT